MPHLDDQSLDTRSTKRIRVIAITVFVLGLVYVGLDRNGTIVVLRNHLAAMRILATHKWKILDPATFAWPTAPTVAALFTSSPLIAYTSLNHNGRATDVDVAAAQLTRTSPFVLIVARPRDTSPKSPGFFLDISLGVITRVPAGVAVPVANSPAVHMRIVGRKAAAMLDAPLPREVVDRFDAIVESGVKPAISGPISIAPIVLDPPPSR